MSYGQLSLTSKAVIRQVLSNLCFDADFHEITFVGSTKLHFSFSGFRPSFFQQLVFTGANNFVTRVWICNNSYGMFLPYTILSLVLKFNLKLIGMLKSPGMNNLFPTIVIDRKSN